MDSIFIFSSQSELLLCVAPAIYLLIRPHIRSSGHVSSALLINKIVFLKYTPEMRVLEIFFADVIRTSKMGVVKNSIIIKSLFLVSVVESYLRRLPSCFHLGFVIIILAEKLSIMKFALN